MKIGYFLSSEEWGPRDMVTLAAKAEQAGFEGLWISDHYHPWSDEQGHSPFVWSVIGALAEATEQKVTTAVTCPTVRIHPAIIAQAAATASLLLNGRFCLGLGSGEALNEHILGDRWPEADERLEMLEEAVDVIRTLWQGGVQSLRGNHYRVERCRVYDLPEPAPPILISGFGPKAIDLAARIGDGYVTVGPDAESVDRFRSQARRGKLVQGGIKVCWGPDEAQARQTAYRLWPNDALPGELAQILPTPQHFEQATGLVTEEMIAEQTPCGPDIDRHVGALREYADAGFDEVYVQQIGPEQDAFFEVYREHVLPQFN
ncbi:MAG: TIGR03557 family F420-dependent LLM class oxidoreductase [Solirubrobacterales bacterium]|nr:TIGR03557 family F420-dependent LLM class oxidoreductase [Solirubrobacterales bacterium]MBV9365729.1 TIGR03557 family F420-dependent LLM class oxidoreductase [Solirubrobacterales bacterium]